MIEEIKHNGELLALIVRKGHGKPGINFVTAEKEPLQFGILRHPEDHKIKPHVHKDVPRTIIETQEVLYLESGLARIDLFDEKWRTVNTAILHPGDTIVLIRGGHGFRFLRDSVVIYVKQGPYYGKDEDKTVW